MNHTNFDIEADVRVDSPPSWFGHPLDTNPAIESKNE